MWRAPARRPPAFAAERRREGAKRLFVSSTGPLFHCPFKIIGLRRRAGLHSIVSNGNDGRAAPENLRERRMLHKVLTLTALTLFALTGIAAAQTTPPPFSTRRAERTDNVYISRYQAHQSMFIVTPKGVIATDPIGGFCRAAVTGSLPEIKTVTDHTVNYTS